MGNIFYALLTEYWPFEGLEEKKAQEKIMSGERPRVDETILEDSADIAIDKAMRMCWEQDPIARASANDVRAYLDSELAKHRSDT